jgi:ligand-binding sensor domain-containing protein
MALVPLCLLHAALEPLERSFTVHRWTSDDGLPGNSVQDLGVGPDGLLWGVSGSEIWRFDGARFVTTPAALAAINDGERMIESLVITRDNGVHIQLVL